MFSQSLQAKSVYKPWGKGPPTVTAQQVGSCLGNWVCTSLGAGGDSQRMPKGLVDVTVSCCVSPVKNRGG